MKRLVILVAVWGMASVAAGEVLPRACLADGNTPLELVDGNTPFVYQDIMVGTRLTIIVDSNVAEYWSGSLALADANLAYAVLYGRDYNEVTFDYEGSHLPAAGDNADVDDWISEGIQGFDLYTDPVSMVAGDWFIIDYNAVEIGQCSVGYYDHSISWVYPIDYLKFTHVRTRDFNNDTKVNFIDFAILASYWQMGCSGPDWCEGTDLNMSDHVNADDLALFIDYWLEKTQ